jgi:hypothetical protein
MPWDETGGADIVGPSEDAVGVAAEEKVCKPFSGRLDRERAVADALGDPGDEKAEGQRGERRSEGWSFGPYAGASDVLADYEARPMDVAKVARDGSDEVDVEGEDVGSAAETDEVACFDVSAVADRPGAQGELTGSAVTGSAPARSVDSHQVKGDVAVEEQERVGIDLDTALPAALAEGNSRPDTLLAVSVGHDAPGVDKVDDTDQIQGDERAAIDQGAAGHRRMVAMDGRRVARAGIGTSLNAR